jgi:serine/threonine protein kinase
MPADAPFVVGDRWRCESLIASTPTGTVWRARDQVLDRWVAVRVYLPHLLEDLEVRRRVERSLAIAARLQHDNVACLFDVVVDQGRLVAISELVEGPTLQTLGARLAPLADAAVAAIGVQLADGAAAMHTAGAAHRHLSPDRVRVTTDGTLKILGLGAARLLEDESTTSNAGLSYSPGHLAPEQLGGARGDHRTDVYAIGLILWELATGDRPFEADDPAQAVTSRQRLDLPALRAVRPRSGRRLSDAVELATRCDPAARWQDARELAADLLGQCDDRPKTIVQQLARGLLPARPASISSLDHEDPSSTARPRTTGSGEPSPRQPHR